MKLGVFTVMLPDLTPEEAVTALKQEGYDGVEWRVAQVPSGRQDETPSFWGNNLCTLEPTQAEAKRARDLADSAGLELPNLGTYIGLGELDKVEAALAFAETAHAPHFRVGFGNFNGHYAEQFGAAQAFLDDVIGLTRGSGVKPLVEIHHGTLLPSASLAERLLARFSPDEVGVIHDAGNMVFEGFEDYRLGLELLGPYLAHVHLKNARFVAGEDSIQRAEWSPFEEGVVNFPKLLEALYSVGYDGWLVVEDFSAARPSREALSHDLKFIKELLAASPVSA